MFTSFLIKYAEIGVKGNNRYLFEDALVRQIRHALKRCDGMFKVHKNQGRIYVDALSEFDFEETVEQLQTVFVYVLEQSFVQPGSYAANGECLFNLFVFPFFCREGSGLPDVDCGSGACAAFANDGCRIFWDGCHGDWF